VTSDECVYFIDNQFIISILALFTLGKLISFQQKNREKDQKKAFPHRGGPGG
jgi:hypothetical protein